MESAEETSFLKPVRGKVIAASLLACVAIGLALAVTYFSFYGLLDKVDELSNPNNKLKTLSNLFEQITKLDQEQRQDAIKNPKKSYRDFLNESKSLVATIDSLHQMSWEDRRQEERLEAMKRILHKRDYLLVEYLKLKSDFVFNKKYSDQLDSLTDILTKSKPLADSSVKTTQKKTTTTTYLPETEEKKPSFLGRIFGGKKKETPAENRVEVKEEVTIKVDTLAIAQEDSAIQEVGKIMKSLERDQRQQTKQMLQRELELISTNIVLINQLLSILQEVENEEIASIQKKNDEAVSMVSSNIQRIGLIMIVFFLLAAVLVFLIMVDISKSNYYRLQLIKARDEAEQLGQVKQRFLANMSHEIRTPLQSIIGFSEQLIESNSNSEAAEAIQSSSEHLLHIVNEVLDYSRIESGLFVLGQSPFGLQKLVDDVTTVMRIHAQQKGLQFIVNVTGNADVTLIGDAFRLRQILYNLLGNAVKFTSEGFVKFELSIKQKQYVVCHFTITDSGIGIAPQDLGRIFGQFEQGDVNIHKQYGGAGLGLSIVKKLVEIQGGNIDVSSEEGKGSIFTVELGFDKAESSVKVVEEINNPKQQTQPFTGKVILVDDDPLILKLCGILLDKHRIPFKAINQSDKALEEDLTNVTFIFLDIRMPGINGVELCKMLRTKTNARIIALTAHVLPQEQASILESGFDQILTKPFREKDLLEALNVDDMPASNGSTFDLTALRKMTMGDDELLQSIVTQFIEETKQNVTELEQILIQSDSKAVREIVHKFSGRTAQMGNAELAKKFHEVEIKLDNGEELNDVREEINMALTELGFFLEDIQKEELKNNGL